MITRSEGNKILEAIDKAVNDICQTIYKTYEGIGIPVDFKQDAKTYIAEELRKYNLL